MSYKYLINIIILAGLLPVLGYTKLSGGETEADEPLMLILPALQPVVIDGDLDEWDKSGKVGPATFDEDVIDEYSATFYAMYDKDYLYLSAVILQPHPPYNLYPFKGMGPWDSDDVIIRMTSNPALDFPISLPKEVSDSSSDIFTADFWWNHEKKETYWDSYHGMLVHNKTKRREEMPGVKAEVKIPPDGEGYTMEIQVPWKVINPDFHPRSGDMIAFTWEVSIASGNPSEPKRIFQIFANGGNNWAFMRPDVWGRAVFK